MAVNRFNKASEQHVMNTYVPLPFQEILAAGQARQQRYDQSVSTMETYNDALTKMNAIPFDKGYLQEKQAQFQGTIENLANQDLSDPTVNLQMRKEIRGLASDPTLRNIQQSYAGYQSAIEEGKKENWLPYQTYNALVKPMQQYQAAGGAKAGVFSPGQVGKHIDIEKELTDEFIKMPAQKFAQIVGTELGSKWLTKTSTETRDPKLVALLVQNRILSNPAYLNQKQQEAIYGAARTGENVTDYLKNDITGLANRVGAFVAVNNLDVDKKMNPYTLDDMQATRKKKEEASNLPQVLTRDQIPGLEHVPELDAKKLVDAVTPIPGYAANVPGRYQKEIQKSGTTTTGPTAFTFKNLSENEKAQINQVMLNAFNLSPEKIKYINNVLEDRIKGSPADKEKLRKRVGKFMAEVSKVITDNYGQGNMQISDPVGLYDNKGSDFLTEQFFGTKKLTKGEGIAGIGTNAKIFTPDGDILRGSQLEDKYPDLFAEGANIRVIGRVDPRNSTALRDKDFANALVVAIGTGANTKLVRVALPQDFPYEYAPYLRPTQGSQGMIDYLNSVPNNAVPSRQLSESYKGQVSPYLDVETLGGVDIWNQ